MPQNHNIDYALAWGRKTLFPTSDAPNIDVERLLVHVMGKKDTSWLYAHGDTQLTSLQEDQFKQYIERRAKGEPLAYILGYTEFYGRKFAVTPDVLIPRPETEELVRQSLEYIKPRAKQTFTVADIGTGSGCIAITLALELPKTVHLIATDVSPRALEIARKNAEHHGVASSIEFREGDMLEPLQNTPLNLIVSNPPYVPTAELREPPTNETRGLAFEPHNALDGGEDGNRHINILAASKIPAFLEAQNGEVITWNI